MRYSKARRVFFFFFFFKADLGVKITPRFFRVTPQFGALAKYSAIQTWQGSSSLLEEWSEIPIVFVVSFVGETAKVYDR